MSGKVSRAVKRAAPRRRVKIDAVERMVLLEPLKVWARREAAGEGEQADLCRRWLMNKNRRLK